MVIFAIGDGVAAYLCIKGIDNRNHKNIKPLMVLLSLWIFYPLLNIFSDPVALLFGMIMYGYQYIVLYSLYSKFQDESNIGPIAQETIGED